VAKPRQTTKAKGLGHPHRMQRERLLRAHVEGSECELCGRPMYRAQGLQADHVIPRVIAGPRALATRLVHASCNARAGAVLGNQLRQDDEPFGERGEPERLAFPWP
jgi:hypothetical protein